MKIKLDVEFETTGEAARWLAKYTTSPCSPVYELLLKEFPSKGNQSYYEDLAPQVAEAAVRLLMQRFNIQELK